MDLLDDPTFKNKYRKNKLRVKRWENDFKEKHGRKPNKEDIRGADDAIKESYKMYYKMKTRALDETLSDITFPDESRANVSANTSPEAEHPSTCALRTSRLCDRSPGANLENVDPSDSKETIVLPGESETLTASAVGETPNVDGAWGSHLNRDVAEGEKAKSERPRSTGSTSRAVGLSASFRLSQKSFSSSRLTKRNPRKSLSTNKLGRGKSDVAATNEASGTSETAEEPPDGFDPNTCNLFVEENVKVVLSKAKTTLHPTSAIHRLIKGETTIRVATIDRNLNHGWLERCTSDDPQGMSSGTSRVPTTLENSSPLLEKITTTTATPVTTPINDVVTDSEDFVCNSDSEDERRKKRVRNVEATSERLAKRQKFLELNDHVDSSFDRVTTESGTIVATTLDPISSSDTITADTKQQQQQQQQQLGKTSDKRKSVQGRRETTRKRAQVSPRLARTKRPTRKKTRKASSAAAAAVEEEGEEEKLQEEANIPIYAVEATAISVVPRFAIPENTSGDLVDDFARSVETRTTEASIGETRPLERGTSGGKTAREKLQEKVASGRINENFVRINLKKKVFVRGKRGFNSSKYRKNQWKQRKKELSSSEAALDLADFVEKNGGACFKCGQTGHYASRCNAAKGQDLLPNDGNEEYEDDDSPQFLTLEQVEKLAEKNAVSAHSTRIERLPACPSLQSNDSTRTEQMSLDENYDELFDQSDFETTWPDSETPPPPTKLKGHKIPDQLLAKLLKPINGSVEALYPLSTDGSPLETPDEVFQGLRMFGHDNFRPGQEKAVMRILTGQSTLVTLSTGSGKSLCYQLPAYLYARRSKCVTLVVSPLVSLMDDQVSGIPKFLSAAALHTGQTPKVRQEIMKMVKAGQLDILLVSPEAVVAGERSTGFGGLFSQLPPIAFACIDEAHCISQWSHNFRPSYLMICRVLLEKLQVRTILGLTATATRATAESIVRHLNVPDGTSGVISDIPMPKNLTLTVSKDEQRDRALVNLLLSPRFEDCDSVIVYCTRREECTRIAGLIRIALQTGSRDSGAFAKSKCSPYAEAYHAGLPASRRQIIQKSFMSGQTRIVVATVAFGMGINKANIRSVIHYNMPASFEGYVQEVGRAGRDNLPAHCHLFLSPSQNADKLELRRHIFANGVDRHMIRRLLGKIFVACSCRSGSGGGRCPGHEVAIPIDETVRALDITEESISTLLCYLELHPKRYITVLSSVYVNAKVSSYAGPKALKMAAQTSPPLAMAIALDLKRGISHESSSIVEFPVVDVAAAIGWDSGVVKNHLKNLEWKTVEGDMKAKRSAISVHFDTLGFRVRAPGDLTDSELDEALEALADRAQSQEISALRQLETIHASLSKFSMNCVERCVQVSQEVASKSESLKEIIREYFRSEAPLSILELPPPQPSVSSEATIANDVRGLISSYRDNNFTGRAVARIFHGIQSPNYPALVWSRCRFWRSHLETDFNLICRIANREILAMR